MCGPFAVPVKSADKLELLNKQVQRVALNGINSPFKALLVSQAGYVISRQKMTPGYAFATLLNTHMVECLLTCALTSWKFMIRGHSREEVPETHLTKKNANTTRGLNSFTYFEAFQVAEATSEMSSKTVDKLFLVHRQPTEIGRKSARVCDRINSLLIPLCFLATATFVHNQTGDKQSRKRATNRHLTADT